MRLRLAKLALVLLCAPAAAAARAAAADVKLARVPQGGLQPQVAVGHNTVVHLIFLTGKPTAADVNYVRSGDGGTTWSTPLRVNDSSAPAIASGTMRGPHLAVGPTGTVHVAWMASPKAMMYARLLAGADAFESPRNVVTSREGLDGGGSVAAGANGRVYVAWHAPSDNPHGDEASRRIWLTASDDDGQTFSPERAIYDRPTGACGCCGMRLFARDDDALLCIYRGAADMTSRGQFLIGSFDAGKTFGGEELAPMKLGVCLMSTAAFAAAGDDTLVAWETLGKISWGRIGKNGTSVDRAIAAPGDSKSQKHPALAVSRDGDVLLAWTEGTRFGKGGSVAWQMYDSTGNAKEGEARRSDGVPAHSLPAAFCNDRNEFIILY